MDKEKLNIIYKMVLNNEQITLGSLKEKGYSDEEINYLFKDDRLYKVDNHYFIKYTSDLLDYAKDILRMKVIPKEGFHDIYKCARKCIEFEPDDFETNAFYLLILFDKKTPEEVEIQKVLSVLNRMKNNADEREIKDVNLYYFLINHAFELPQDNVQEARFIKIEEVMLKSDDFRYNYNRIKERNRIRKNAYSQKYTFALSKNRRLNDPFNSSIIYDKLFEKILNFNASRRSKLTSKTYELALNGRILELAELYNEENERRFITNHEFYNLKLTLKYIDMIIKEREVIVTKRNHTTIESAIDDNDFNDALRLYVEDGSIGKFNVEESARYVLLKALNDYKGSNKKVLSMVNKNTN